MTGFGQGWGRPTLPQVVVWSLSTLLPSLTRPVFLPQHEFDMLTAGKGVPLRVHLALTLTCADPILQGVSAVNQDLLQGLGVVRELQVEALHAFQQLVWVMEVQHLGGTIKRLADVIEEDVHHLQEELHSLLLSIFSRKQI